MFLSFKSWLAEGCPGQTTFNSDPFVQREDLTGTQLSNKMRELEKLLKSHDYYFMFSDDSRSYKRGQDSSDRIEKLAHEIGPDGLKLYRKYLKKNESVEEKEKKRTKKEKEEDDELVNVKPKIPGKVYK